MRNENKKHIFCCWVNPEDKKAILAAAEKFGAETGNAPKQSPAVLFAVRKYINEKTVK